MRLTKPTMFLLLLISIVSFSLQGQNRSNEISGTVTDGQSPLSKVTITIKGTEKGTSTDSKGEYVIKTNPRDVLVYSYIGMQPVEIVIEDVTRILNIILWPKIEELDEVIVTKSKRKNQKDLGLEYATNKNIVNSNFGYLNQETAGYVMRVVDGEDLNPAAVDLLVALQSKLPSISIASIRRPNDAIFLRGPKPAIFEIDGQLFTEAPSWLSINRVDRIAVIPGLAFAVKYGAIAAGGVVIINTKNAGNEILEEGSNKPYDQAKLRSNVYANDAINQKQLLKNQPIYFQELYASSNEAEASAVYTKHKKNFGSLYVFVLDVYQFFYENYDNVTGANQILTDNKVVFEDNPIALKALAYTHQRNDDLEKAHQIYKEVFMLRPNYTQSYMDLANSYREIGDYKKAASIYARYSYLIEEGFLRAESEMFTNIIDRELNNLVSLKGKKMLSKKELKKFVLDKEFNGTRIVFEWNDSEAEFELQFVNPENKYFKSEHSLVADAQRINVEKLSGYSSEEYLIDDSIRGSWLVNVKYLGNKSLSPAYIKATVYHNYGSASQRKETKLFKMNLRNVNQQWFAVSNTETIASN